MVTGKRWSAGGRAWTEQITPSRAAKARIGIATWITDFCTARQLHSVCGFKSPIDYENGYWAGLSEGLAASASPRRQYSK
ncbi:hypothetical protein [Streptomyces nigrescens]|uniref:hypothetical protein n=1 Tax=Streptomyces nigrescens TaxID=1920 RepID=UPI00346BD4FC